MDSMGSNSSHWCYSCSRFVRILESDSSSIVCSNCQGGFVEEIENPPPTRSITTARNDLDSSQPRRRRFPAAAMYMLGGGGANNRPNSDLSNNNNPGFRSSRRRNGGDRSPFNPVIVLRGPSDNNNNNVERERGSFELYYDDGAGSGLQPLPASMSDFLMGSGFDRLLDQLAQIEINGVGGNGRCEHPPASKAAIESMPTVEIVGTHIMMDSHCAVCKEAFELGTDAREMPCKHIYHSDCILPWLSLRNSCPVCRHELPAAVTTDVGNVRTGSSPVSDGSTTENEIPSPVQAEDDAVGLTIWRLPGGGFAVGRFSGGRRAAERELPVVYTEMDGDFNNGGAPRRISWTSRGSRSNESGGFGGFFRNFVSFFRRNRTSSSNSISESRTTRRSQSSSVLGRASRRQNRAWPLVNSSAMSRW
ncbi:hypothetical protein IFM89_000621 [Coptis chinensis]|uniref:RING-type E3 ubiquitin transferase n=1 Tax=Coptis chinensis TaxID=261450 RepID=A0A835HCB6_9MAGN|nr:hypothetical protein IFM89_000621 [Coptis chinensis]